LARTPLRPDDPTRIGHYRLTSRLGSGGMGVVYLGVSWDGAPVAVKVLRPELAGDEEFRRRFGREVAALVQVKGVCTVRVIEADSQSATPFVVTEYAEGPSLSEYIDRNGPAAPDMLFGLATGLAEALTTIHAVGIMHRDLKPSNIILTDGGPKVIDFGIARRQDTTAVTRTGMMIGSMGFMAPEQISGHPGPEADIFAWGVTVAYAAAGRSPFGAGSTHSVLYRIMYGDADIASVPDSLLPLVEASLAKDPQSRPTARQLLDRLTSASSRPGKPDDTTQVILARTWQSGSHATPPPAARPAEANQVPPRQPAAPAPWPHVARAAAPAPATAPPVTAPPATAPPVTAPPAAAAPAADTPTADTPTTDSPIPVLPAGAVPSSAWPSAAVPSAATPGPATPAPEKVPVGRRMATIATSALVAMRLRRPGRPDEPKS
jgi:serine/threonine protein kinase